MFEAVQLYLGPSWEVTAVEHYGDQPATNYAVLPLYEMVLNEPLRNSLLHFFCNYLCIEFFRGSSLESLRMQHDV